MILAQRLESKADNEMIALVKIDGGEYVRLKSVADTLNRCKADYKGLKDVCMTFTAENVLAWIMIRHALTGDCQWLAKQAAGVAGEDGVRSEIVRGIDRDIMELCWKCAEDGLKRKTGCVK